MSRRSSYLFVLYAATPMLTASRQIDAEACELVPLGSNQPLNGDGPRVIPSGLNNRHPINPALRMAMCSIRRQPLSFFLANVSVADARRCAAERLRTRIKWILHCNQFNRCRRVVAVEQATHHGELRWHRKVPA